MSDAREKNSLLAACRGNKVRASKGHLRAPLYVRIYVGAIASGQVVNFWAPGSLCPSDDGDAPSTPPRPAARHTVRPYRSLVSAISPRRRSYMDSPAAEAHIPMHTHMHIHGPSLTTRRRPTYEAADVPEENTRTGTKEKEKRKRPVGACPPFRPKSLLGFLCLFLFPPLFFRGHLRTTSSAARLLPVRRRRCDEAGRALFFSCCSPRVSAL